MPFSVQRVLLFYYVLLAIAERNIFVQSAASGSKTLTVVENIVQYSEAAMDAKAKSNPARNAPPAVVAGGDSSRFVTAGIPRKTASKFAISISRAREKIAQTFKFIVRPKSSVARPAVAQLIAPVYKIDGGSRNNHIDQLVNSIMMHTNRSVLYDAELKSMIVTQAEMRTMTAENGQSNILIHSKLIDVCWLYRWNFEFPLARLPGVIIAFLADDTISGSNFQDKADFLAGFMQHALDVYNKMRQSPERLFTVFQIPSGTILKHCEAVAAEEPFTIAVHNLLGIYSAHTIHREFLADLVEASTVCTDEIAKEPVFHEVSPCFFYKINVSQLLDLRKPDSIFRNDDICRYYFSPPMLSCISRAWSSNCTVDMLLTINMFIRNFFLCAESLPRDTAILLQDDEYLRDFEKLYGSASPICQIGVFGFIPKTVLCVSTIFLRLKLTLW
ncbi:uncharacterized protein LOC129583993 [Paramacrobiotus metropolitanus]|uniref:uncharacterized protein LOC129583993 n=1 Tax=Paramacrobiotus metropolitanus TaxID=2943436 RepID=UPI00244629B6|nr:uncharacterized protein LOC129583993 [Paramacrobiotus metropolitanus]XP_055332041.1 uncharacterized protein LOC129583993 [Paramacrobiotus metropolitanus]XP_055332043.1 uncharacterized protein LOC129583993 [Paramacrobiotus metropolitanus]